MVSSGMFEQSDKGLFRCLFMDLYLQSAKDQSKHSWDLLRD